MLAPFMFNKVLTSYLIHSTEFRVRATGFNVHKTNRYTIGLIVSERIDGNRPYLNN